MDYILERRAVAQQVICAGRAPSLADTLLSWKIAVLWTLGDLVDFAAQKAVNAGLRSPTELALPRHGYSGLWLLGNSEQMRFLAALRVAAAPRGRTALSDADGLSTRNTLSVSADTIDFPPMRSAVESTIQESLVLVNVSPPDRTSQPGLISSGAEVALHSISLSQADVLANGQHLLMCRWVNLPSSCRQPTGSPPRSSYSQSLIWRCRTL